MLEKQQMTQHLESDATAHFVGANIFGRAPRQKKTRLSLRVLGKQLVVNNNNNDTRELKRGESSVFAEKWTAAELRSTNINHKGNVRHIYFLTNIIKRKFVF